MAIDIISRLGEALVRGTSTPDRPKELTRDIGGHKRQNQPFITGYFQAFFQLPEMMFKDKANEASQWLHSTCEGFTPHTMMVNFADIIGQGQVGASFPTSVTITREFTLTFREYQNQPILKIIRQWSSLFDPFVGVSPLKGAEFIPINYKGAVCIVQTKPVQFKDESEFKLTDDNVEEIYIYEGVVPMTIPFDTAAASDVAANDFVQHAVSFRFDGSPVTYSDDSAKVLDYANTLMGKRKYMNTYDVYLKSGLTNPST